MASSLCRAAAVALLQAVFYVCYSPAMAMPTHDITITQIPSDLSITLKENQSVLLQFHVQGQISGSPRSTVRFGEAEQLSCMGTKNYATLFQSKPLVKNASLVCEQAYWLNLNEHRQKYEVRLTNGVAARLVNSVTVRLEVHYLEGEILGGLQAEFEVTMLKARATPAVSSTAATLNLDERIATPTTTPTEKTSTEIIGTTSEKELATVAVKDSTPPLTTPQTTPTTSTLPNVSAQRDIIELLKSSIQNQITLAAGFVAVMVIIVQFAVILWLAKSRRKRRAKPSDTTATSDINDQKIEHRV